ncbi:hypothetical protein LTR70_002609 [Exophiala xenobiotica]|uniref:Glucosamine-phosphate N-acetyltransferase n=1 Tax=Lithohypha guttulata TaxID=1690604 RepID=A0ABR0KIB6_9EURO|nr:hypothetical protein LTR24_002214 [Lithohypha guttulata]KAK5325229.1 hypothetical protein LTR70_002609 [Exophiala xenobiotica]
MSSQSSDIHVEVQPPPGSVVAPNGFPADPHPKNAPQIFLDAMEVRIKVFCDEQKCAVEPELDVDDPKSWSWVAYQQSLGSKVRVPVSTLRIVPPPHPPHPNSFHDPDEEPYMKLTRVATMSHARGQGLNKLLMNHAFDYLVSQPERVSSEWRGLVLTHAQVSVEGLYAKLDFVTDDRLGRWDEEGIEHLGMWKRLSLPATTG